MPRYALACLCLLGCLASSSIHADTVVIGADRMTGTGRALEQPRILITDGRISAVGAKNTVVPAGARHIELPGLTLLPGLIDLQVHLTSDPHYSGHRSLSLTDSSWRVVGVANARRARLASRACATSARRNCDDFGLKPGIENGYVVLQSAALIDEGRGGQARCRHRLAPHQ